MKRLISLFLVVCVCLSPVLAAGSGFSDVPAGSWYAQAVEVCVDAGLMSGTGDGRFSPEKPLTGIECLALAARLHEIQNGGDGVLPHAPEDWGKISLTTEDGTVISDYGDSDTWVWTGFSANNSYLSHSLNPSEREALSGEPYELRATVRLDGSTYTGTAKTVDKYGETLIYFVPTGNNGADSFLKKAVYQQPAPGKWFRDAFYYAESYGLTSRLPETSVFSTGPVSRETFARYLTVAAGALEPINQMTELPDTQDKTVLSLYNAGILTGTDQYGTFGGSLGLSRAEGAAMLARVLQPELRLTFTPAPLPYRDYTLTELDPGKRDYTIGRRGANLLLITYPPGGLPMGSALLRIDGSLLPMELGVDVVTWADNGLVLLSKNYPNTLNGVMDAADGHMVLPFQKFNDCMLTPDGHILTREAVIEPNNSWILWDQTGVQVAALSAYGPASWTSYSGGLSQCTDRDGRNGYVDASGDWVIPAQWDMVGSFQGEYALVKYGGKWGVIDRAGRTVVPCQYNMLSDCGGGLFHYNSGDDMDRGWVWADGRTVRSAYAGSGITYCGGYITTGNRFLNADGVPVTPEFDLVGPVADDGSAFVGLDGKVYRLQFQG